MSSANTIIIFPYDADENTSKLRQLKEKFLQEEEVIKALTERKTL